MTERELRARWQRLADDLAELRERLRLLWARWP
jgi:hypothetical protein